MYTVKLTYFKPTGKYYAEGKYEVPEGYEVFDVWAEVNALRADGKLPGLVEGYGKDFTILVEVPGHPQDHPRLIGGIHD